MDRNYFYHCMRADSFAVIILFLISLIFVLMGYSIDILILTETVCFALMLWHFFRWHKSSKKGKEK